MKKTWNVAIYARVSTDKKDQQESIPAQVQSLRQWLVEKSGNSSKEEYRLVEVYEDLGFSGSNFDRDSFIRMKRDIEQGKINMVLTRDLSRFSRNYILAGYYIEDYFKINGIRFVSVLDNVDTIEEVDDIVPFKNVLNEMYIKDCSRRVKDALKQRMIRGSCIASKPPYGYRFETIFENDNKTITLVPAEDESTQIVQEIFNMYLEGFGLRGIAENINHRNIPPPSSKIKNFNKAKSGLWASNTIYSILTNPKYAGIMVQRRWKKVSYKSKKVITSDKEEWINGGEFQGIVDKETFEEVQSIMKKRARCCRQKDQKVHIFSSVLRCNECGGSLCFRNNFNGYKCTNSQTGRKKCTAHSIKEETLMDLVRADLKKYADEFVERKEFYKNLSMLTKKNSSHTSEFRIIENSINKLDKQLESIYQDKTDGVISERNFIKLIYIIQKKQENLLHRKQEIMDSDPDAKNDEDIYRSIVREVDEILNFDNIDRLLIETLIDKIVISEEKGVKKKIDIYYKFKEAALE